MHAAVPNPRDLLDALAQVVHHDRHNVGALCKIGQAFHQLRRADDVRKCYKLAVESLHYAIRIGEAEAALNFELLIYSAFVKTVEDEQHYYRCFSDWREDMARLGRKFREPARTASGERVGFVLQTGTRLGHTEVLFEFLRARSPDRGAPLLYTLSVTGRQFIERAESLGITVVPIKQGMPPNSPWLDVLLRLRERLRADGVRTVVWVASPVWAAFALSMRLAPVQIYWTLRFHPVNGSYIDGYITYGQKHEHERTFGKQKWLVCPVPLAIDAAPVQAGEIAQLRTRFPQPVLLGTLAREEKIDSAPFLKAVAAILKANPDAGYLWTGKSEPPGIREFFRAAGVGDRCHFVGWVNTRLYSAALDVFLETYPLGCGITGYQALAAGVPLLSYLERNTVFGMQFWHQLTADANPPPASPRLDDPSRFPILCARDNEHYVQLANRLVTDAHFRAEAGARGQAFYREEIGNNSYYADRFFDTIQRITESTMHAGAAAVS